MMKNQIIITYDPEFRDYVVDVPKLFGWMSQGKAIDESLSNIKGAIKG